MLLHNALRKSRTLIDGIGRMVGFNEPGSGVERLGETLTPILHPWGMPEWAYLRGEQLGSLMRSVGAVAAEFGYATLTNPTGSGYIMVVESATATAGGSQVYVAQVMTNAVAAATLLTSQGGEHRDRRFAQNNNNMQTIAVSLAGTDPASNIGRFLEQAIGITGIMVTSLPCILPPGHSYALTCMAVNTIFTASFGWRERLPFRGELS